MKDSQATTFLKKFVSIPSLSRDEEEAAAYLVGQMQKLGFNAFIDDAGNAIGEIGTDGPLVALLGHIDTVSGDIPVRIQNNNLYGRGSVDAKGSFATFVCAAARAHQAGTLACRVVLIGAVEEEIATSKGAHYAVKQYAPDYCVIGEPSGWERITLGYKGRLIMHYRYEQPAAHSAGELSAAPEHIVAVWNAVLEHCAAHNTGRERLFDQMMPSLRRIASGSDGLRDWAEAVIGLRLPEDVHPYTLQIALSDITRDIIINQAPDECHSQTSFEGACPAFRSSRTTPLAGAFVRAIRTMGGKSGFVHKTGTSDMNVAGPAWRCPIVAYGPGDSRLDHTPDEHLPLEDYHRAIAVLTHVLENIR